MPAALYANAVDAYCTGEPFGAAAQRAGYARPIRMTRDEWPRYICCVLTAREELIRDHRAMVQDLVDHVLGAGVWLDAQQQNRDKAAELAAGREFFNQDPNIIKFVMENPTDRVTYGDLRMIRSEFEDLMQLSVEAGTLKRPIAYERYVDESFASHASPPRSRSDMRALAERCSRCALLARLRRGAAEDAGFIAGVFEPPRAAPELALRGSDGKELRLYRYRGKVVIVGFGFTSCPDVCPTTLAALAGARKKLGADAERVQVVYVTVDPERDDAERLRTYLRTFDPTFIGGTGTAEQLAAVRESYGIAVGQQPGVLVLAFLVHVPDRSRGKDPRADAVRAQQRRLRARRQAAPARRRARRGAGPMIKALIPLAGLAIGVTSAALAPISSPSREEIFEIPQGTWARRMAGDAGRDPAQPDPAHARRARRARAPESRRRAADLRPDAA